MAKDDYDVIVFKVLVYLYAVFKRKRVFDECEFLKVAGNDTNEDYFIDVLHSMQQESLIHGLCVTPVWGGQYILTDDLQSMGLAITPTGIHYLQENDRMHKVQAFLLEHADLFASLIKLVLV